MESVAHVWSWGRMRPHHAESLLNALSPCFSGLTEMELVLGGRDGRAGFEGVGGPAPPLHVATAFWGQTLWHHPHPCSMQLPAHCGRLINVK